MYKIWQGQSPHLVLAMVGAFISGAVLVMHIWAFGQFGWPKDLKAKYNPPTVASAIR
jgi:hypothetical protein